MINPDHDSSKIDRRTFLGTVVRSVFGLAITSSVAHAYSGIEQVVSKQDGDLVSIELASKASLLDPLLTRLIDTDHPISESEISQTILPNLIPIPDKFKGIRTANESVRVHSCMLTQLENLFGQANLDQTGLFIHSGFRSYEEQAIAYSQAKDKRVVLKPGSSQHHSGLAIDFTSSDIGKLIDIGLHFESTKAGKWLENHSWEYGFVQSYISNHDGVKNEPWHYLFIGTSLAEAYHRLKVAGWYGDVFLLQEAVNLGFKQIVLEV